jgi:hypothetical protein
MRGLRGHLLGQILPGLVQHREIVVVRLRRWLGRQAIDLVGSFVIVAKPAAIGLSRPRMKSLSDFVPE